MRSGLVAAALASGIGLLPLGVGAEMKEVARIAVPADVQVRFLMVSPDGRQLTAVCGDRKLRLWSLAPGQGPTLLRTLDVEGEAVGTLAYSDDGAWLAAGTSQGTVAVFKAETGERVARFATTSHGPGGVQSLALAAHGTLVAVGPMNGPAELWDVASVKQRATLPAPFGGSNALAFSPDGMRLASADEDTGVRLYDAAGVLRATVDDLPLESFALTFTADGKQLVLGGADKRITVLDAATGRMVRQFPKQADAIAWLVAPRAGGTVVSGSFKDESMNLPGPTLTWALSGAGPREISARERFNGGGALADGRLLLTTMREGAIVVWDVQ